MPLPALSSVTDGGVEAEDNGDGDGDVFLRFCSWDVLYGPFSTLSSLPFSQLLGNGSTASAATLRSSPFKLLPRTSSGVVLFPFSVFQM